MTRRAKGQEIVVPKRPLFVPTPPDEIQLPALVLACGRRGSGKGVAISSKLHHLKRAGLADRVWLISPTFPSNEHLWGELTAPEDRYNEMSFDSVGKVQAAIDGEADDWDDYCTKSKLYRRWRRYVRQDAVDMILNDELLEFERHGILDMVDPPQSKYGHRPTLHVIVDDLQGSPLLRAGPNPFVNMLIRHRHLGRGLGASMYLMMQNYLSNGGGCPRAVRENATHLCLFGLKDPKMLAKVAEEASGVHGPDTFLQMYHKAVQGDHDFLMCDFCPKSKDRTFRRNWDEYLQPADTSS
jgi:hypothetical protein